jgi:hypothetical protein
VNENGLYDLDINSLPKNIDLRINGLIIKDDVINDIRNKISLGSKILKEKCNYNLNKKNNTIQTLINIDNKQYDIKNISKMQLIDLIYNKCNSIQKISNNVLSNIKDKITNCVNSNYINNNIIKKFTIKELKFDNFSRYDRSNYINFDSFNNKIVSIRVINIPHSNVPKITSHISILNNILS